MAVHCANGLAETRPNTTLRVGIGLEPPNLDPTSGSAAAIDEVVYANVFEGLTGINSDGEVIPRLASRWDISEDGLVYRFQLRSNVRFHDGTEFDAADVAHSLRRARAPDSANAQRSLFEPIEQVVIISKTVVEIHLRHPIGAFLQHLAWGDAVIVAPESAANNAVHPVGTGPFQFLRWRRGVSIDLERNPHYWGTARNGVDVVSRGATQQILAPVDAISFQIIPDPTAAFAALLAGDIDGFPNYPAPESLAQLEALDQFQVIKGTTEGETILALNHGNPKLQDVRVRRALSHAIDRRAIIDGAMFGNGLPIGSHFPPHHPAYVDLTQRYPHSPSQAKALLDAAGFGEGMQLTLKLPPPSYARRSGEVVAAQLSAVGIDVRIENLEWAQWLTQVFTNKNFEMTIVAHTEPMDLDIYAKDAYYFQYFNQDYNSLIDRLAATNDPAIRSNLLRQAQITLSEDAVNVFLFQAPKLAVWSNQVSRVWKNSPIQANDFTQTLKQSTSHTAQTRQGTSKAHLAAIVMGFAMIAGIAYLGFNAGIRFVLQRALGIAATLVAASIIIFVLVEIAPGDPATYMMGLNAQPEALAALRAELGLDQSPVNRYLAWVGGMLTGDFGTSYTYRSPIAELISERIVVSLPLALYALALAIAFAIPAGLYTARSQGKWLGGAVMGMTQVGIALPNFWIAILLALVFASGLGWFPVGGFPGWEAGLGAGLLALTLPAIALAIPQAAILTRITRTALLDTLREDYMRTARAKGLSQSAALRRHALGNAAIPLLTILGLQFSFLIAGGIIIENVFYLPGLGRLVFQAILQRDLIVVETVVLLLAAATVVTAFVVDLAYAAVDPRIRKGLMT